MHACSRHRYTLLFMALMLCQLGFWYQTRDIRPDMEVVPTPPGKQVMDALAFGDREFYFRYSAWQLQNFGDSYGRVTSLRYYDYSKIYQWLHLLDGFNSRSDILPSLSAYYFSQTQNNSDNRYLTNYLYAHAKKDVEHKWWWLLQGLYLAMHKMEDMDLALKIAKEMINPKVPAFAQQMVAVVYEKRGEMEAALNIMNYIEEHAEQFDERDLMFMEYFVKDRIKALDQR